MKRIVEVSVVVTFIMIVGCGNLRFAPSEAQKQNAWVHNRTTQIAAQTAEDEAASDKLQALTKLSEKQSQAFVAYHGLPKELPAAETAEEVLGQSNVQLASSATADSIERPDSWEAADSMFELLIGIAALAGGVYGTRAMRFLREAKAKSQALKEIVEGNELFKDRHSEAASEFKAAHRNQSPQTKQIVTTIKG